MKKYQIIVETTDKIYLKQGKPAEYNTYKEAVTEIKKIGKLFKEPLIIREIGTEYIRDLDENAEINPNTGMIDEYKNSILSEKKIKEDKKIKNDIDIVIEDKEIKNEWDKINKIYEKINKTPSLPINNYFNKKNEQINKIYEQIIYIHNIIYNLKNGDKLLNDKLFKNNKENLIFFGEKLIEEINKLNIGEEYINLNYDTIKYY